MVAQQIPKWAEKAKHAVFSVVTYDENDKILNTGNGFFVREDGIALSDYSLFKGAQRAVAINSEGVQMPVLSIFGANEMYDVIKFRVAIPAKKVTALIPAPSRAAVGSGVYILTYSTQKENVCESCRVEETDMFSEIYCYYTLNLSLADKMVSCPVMNEVGQVLALAQKSSGEDTSSICYAVDVNFALSQTVGVLGFSDRALQNIGIKKALPETEEQALAFLFMASSQVASDVYTEMLEDFIAEYPNSSEGYLRRASNRLSLSTEEASMNLVSADLDKALSLAQNKDDVYYNRAKIIYTYLLANPENPYKGWSYDKALEEVKQAIAIQELPIYLQTEGDIHFAKGDYASALPCYEKVNESILASAATYFTAAKTKELMQAPAEEVLALMDSCVSRLNQPYTEESAAYLLERAQARMNAGKAREAVLDYDAYYKAIKGNVNDLFYYYRSQAALQARQYQRTLDDLTKAIELNPQDLTYYAELAVVNIRVGHNEEALKILQDALKIDAEYGEAYRLMGIAQVQMKQTRAACESFAKAKELEDPNVDELIDKYCNK